MITDITAVVGGSSSSTAFELTNVGQYHVDVLVDETEIGQVRAQGNRLTSRLMHFRMLR
jgi:hypothetical protein